MTRLTQTAVCRRLLVFVPLLCLPAAVLFADNAASTRYAIAPSDPTIAPDDPRGTREPSDMTSPRAARRAHRGRSRERMAPDAPTAQNLRDLTAPASPSSGPRLGLGRRLEGMWRTQSQDETGNSAPSPARGSDARRPMATPAAPVAPAAPSEPSGSAQPEPLPAEEVPAIDTIRLTQAAEGTTTSAVPATPDAPPAVTEARVSTLNKPLREIGLVEQADLDGVRPVDVASEITPPRPPVVLTGSYFVAAHPARYLYCFSHNPLYFEDANLERCGIGQGVCQPVCSAAQFIGRTAILPCSMIVTPPCECVTTLGDCPTCHAYPHGADLNR